MRFKEHCDRVLSGYREPHVAPLYRLELLPKEMAVLLAALDLLQRQVTGRDLVTARALERALRKQSPVDRD